MAFESWWRSKHPTDIGELEFKLLREAWEAATIAEREACAKVCDEIPEKAYPGASLFHANARHDVRQGSIKCANAIRNRK